MPPTAYEEALVFVGPVIAQTVEGIFTTWQPDDTLGRVSRNVMSETALGTVDFPSLLTSFASQLAEGAMPVAAWQSACRQHKLRGRELPAADCPAVLGRVRNLNDHAASLAKASVGALTANEAKKLLLKCSGSLKPRALDSFLRDAPWGNYVVWATFDAVNPHADPFDRFPHSHEAICTALGLGHITAEDTLIVLVWDHVDSGSPPLHRPTVADAEDSPYYRPRHDADAPWGLTEPLSPNPDGLQPQPEVVMPETSSQGLRLPFRVIQA